MGTKTLRAVEPDETPELPKSITSVLDATENGSRLDELKQIRRVIARAIDNENTSPRDLAALSRRQIEISKEIDALQRQMSEEKNDASHVEDRPFDAAAI